MVVGGAGAAAARQATLAGLGIEVLDGDIATDDKGRAVDTLRVRDKVVEVSGGMSEAAVSAYNARQEEKRLQEVEAAKK